MSQVNLETIMAGVVSSSDVPRAVVEMVQRLDEMGLVDWQAPLSDGEPFFHHLAHRGCYPHALIRWANERQPQLRDTTGRNGQTLWDTLWRARFESKGSKAWELKSLNQTLMVLMERAPLEQFGEDDAARTRFFQRVLSLEDAPLVESVQAHFAPRLTDQERRKLFVNLSSSNWSAARAEVEDLNTPIVLTASGQTRPFWAWALERGLHNHVKAELEQGAFELSEPVKADIQRWMRVESPSPQNKKQLMEVPQHFPDGLATLDDLGRPLAWRLIVKNVVLLKEFEASKKLKPFLEGRDRAGHLLSYHVAPLLDDPALKQQDLGYWLDPVIAAGFRQPSNGQGLIAQWFASEGSVDRHPDASVIPAWKALNAENKRHPNNPTVMHALWLDPKVWEMTSSAAERITHLWAHEPALFPQLLKGVYPLLKADLRGPAAEASPLRPYLPALSCLWLLHSLLTANRRTSVPVNGDELLPSTDEVFWDKAMGQSWERLPFDASIVSTVLDPALAKVASPSPYLFGKMNAFQAKVRAELTPALTPSADQESRRRLRRRT